MSLQRVKVLARSRLLAGSVQTPCMKDRVPRVRHSDILAGKIGSSAVSKLSAGRRC